ncbi:LuxR C-terminal-related transcriptional regulator [Streptomyces beijiangensis]|uniref:Helix-turn-helix transcriptional regulator n=1 Tax=Streptomyces beijiangensis TaxID=163361 RepID=A0A939F401_9ACTN|nr:LuxR C-terminal-related transcriptional regulator [Streptomyces beijiangensis]MBO0511483.1 helix-turn-helix transcriptional regulator [Streptomyces beijiangensis]
MLKVVGLDEGRESAYRALVVLGSADVPDLARRLALSEADTEHALRGLERQRLAARTSARSRRWVAAPPEAALGALLARQRRELQQAERAAALLAAEYRGDPAAPDVHDQVEVVTGASAVAHRFHQLQQGAAREVCALVTARPDVVTGTENDSEEPATVRGVSYRVVVERALLATQGGRAELMAALSRGEQVRVVDRVPTKLVIADGSRALLPLLGRSADPAVMVSRASGLLEALMGLFESVWREAQPLRIGPDGHTPREVTARPDATDLEILTLLLDGMTDVSVAKQLGLVERTVQRRVKGLMELIGVTSRLQLGWHAYDRGWAAGRPR